jgi:hypothetical protein
VGPHINIGWNYHPGSIFRGIQPWRAAAQEPASYRKLQPLPSRVWMSANQTEMTADSKWPTCQIHPSLPPLLTPVICICILSLYIPAPLVPLSLNHSLCYSSQKTRPLDCHPSYPPAFSLACSIGISPKILVDQVYRLILSWVLDDQHPCVYVTLHSIGDAGRLQFVTVICRSFNWIKVVKKQQDLRNPSGW